jgi:hypothetical protein
MTIFAEEVLLLGTGQFATGASPPVTRCWGKLGALENRKFSTKFFLFKSSQIIIY